MFKIQILKNFVPSDFFLNIPGMSRSTGNETHPCCLPYQHFYLLDLPVLDVNWCDLYVDIGQKPVDMGDNKGGAGVFMSQLLVFK